MQSCCCCSLNMQNMWRCSCRRVVELKLPIIREVRNIDLSLSWLFFARPASFPIQNGGYVIRVIGLLHLHILICQSRPRYDTLGKIHPPHVHTIYVERQGNITWFFENKHVQSFPPIEMQPKHASIFPRFLTKFH